MFDTDAEKADELMNIVKTIADKSEGMIRLAFNEKDESIEYDPESGHFLKLQGARIERDIEIYTEVMGRFCSWEFALSEFLDELFAIKPFCKESFKKEARCCVILPNMFMIQKCTKSFANYLSNNYGSYKELSYGIQ